MTKKNPGFAPKLDVIMFSWHDFILFQLTGLQQMAFPAYLQNNLTLILTFMLPLFLVLSFAFIVPPVLKRIVYEKETGVKVMRFSCILFYNISP